MESLCKPHIQTCFCVCVCLCMCAQQAMLIPQNPSQVHAAAVNGDKNTLQRLITGITQISVLKILHALHFVFHVCDVS